MSQKSACQKSRAKILKEMQANPNDPRHGTNTGYTVGCRCEDCKEARRKYKRQYYKTHSKKIIAAEKQRLARILEECQSDPNSNYHGTRSGHDAGCQCERCRAAGRSKESMRESAKRCKARLKAQLDEDPTDPRHGTPRGYQIGCRCSLCVAAQKKHQYEQYLKRKAREDSVKSVDTSSL